MKNKVILFWIIVFLAIVSAVTIIRKPPTLGLDLMGGSRLTLEAQTTETLAKITPEVMGRLKFAIENRINKLGVAETMVQQSGEKRLIVEIPNVSDLTEAKKFIGDTAELEFKKEAGMDANGNMKWESTGLTGKDVEKAMLSTTGSGEWVVDLKFRDAGVKKFAQLTTDLVGQQLAIYFGGELQSAPVIRQPILNGNAQISGGESSGGFEHTEAQRMVDLLNAGALPVPAEIVEENIVGPTLGADSLEKSKFAGLLGIGFVMLFMVWYYRVPGLIADVALLLYSLMLFAIFVSVPVTLTLAGIAGFILSVGMAVDANILIFERTKEELRAGRNLYTAINSGFDRAFTSIFDSNMTTIITCIILYCLGTSIVKGFALTLAIGVAVSMFSAITITKNFMHLVFGTGELKYPQMFGLKKEEINTAYTATETKREKARFGILE